jgi:hypothetical protein
MEIEKKEHTILIKEQLRDFFVANETNPFVEIKYMNGCGAKAHIVLRI